MCRQQTEMSTVTIRMVSLRIEPSSSGTSLVDSNHPVEQCDQSAEDSGDVIDQDRQILLYHDRIAF